MPSWLRALRVVTYGLMALAAAWMIRAALWQDFWAFYAGWPVLFVALVANRILDRHREPR